MRRHPLKIAMIFPKDSLYFVKLTLSQCSLKDDVDTLKFSFTQFRPAPSGPTPKCGYDRNCKCTRKSAQTSPCKGAPNGGRTPKGASLQIIKAMDEPIARGKHHAGTNNLRERRWTGRAIAQAATTTPINVKSPSSVIGFPGA